ncbi:MAG: 4Fe-4S binding protein [Acidobacteria bacterium]|nr:4Fe-4S binding protein [Acidobacteriota bacterium]
MRYFLVNLAGILLRFIPMKAKTGLVKIGSPTKDSPVLLTGNYILTVSRVKRALREMDVYLLIANSDGINIWCASMGGLFTSKDVIQIIYDSGIDKLVKKKKIIAPQLAASGLEKKEIKKQTGWNIIWGPVYVRDIKAYLSANLHKSPEIKKTSFPLLSRLEMAAAWAFPVSVFIALCCLLFWNRAILPAITLTWFLTLLLFTFFHQYSRFIKKRGLECVGRRVRFARLMIWSLIMIVITIRAELFGYLDPISMIKASVLSLIIVIASTIDTLGFAPGHKSSLHPDKFNIVRVDSKKCSLCGECVNVCPAECFELDNKKLKIPGASVCVQCGACIIQCPCDALSFFTPDGKRIDPDETRQFRLNLSGSRSVEIKKS